MIADFIVDGTRLRVIDELIILVIVGRTNGSHFTNNHVGIGSIEQLFIRELSMMDDT